MDSENIQNQCVDDISNQFTTVDAVPKTGHESSFGANSTAMTFPGVQVEAAILTDSEEGPQEIQIIGSEGTIKTKAD